MRLALAAHSDAGEIAGLHNAVADALTSSFGTGPWSYQTTERGVGRFRREFLLPSVVDGDKVTARLADGVLRIEVPRIGASAPRQVNVT